MKLLESSDSEIEDGGAPLGDESGAELKVNEDFAKRFDHNKKREELARRISTPQQYVYLLMGL